MGNSQHQFGSKTTAEEVLQDLQFEDDNKLDEKVIIVTGGNGGIGYETARTLALQGATVIIGSRNIQRGQQATQQINEQNQNQNVSMIQLDLASFSSIRNFVAEFMELDLPLHVLINNAGIMGQGEYQESEEGLEMSFQTNHLGHFLLTSLLLEKLKESSPARIVNVSSGAHQFAKDGIDYDTYPMQEGNYSTWKAYGLSKLCNILYSRELNRRFAKDGITAYSLHPGVIHTNIGNHVTGIGVITFLGKPFFKTIAQGAATTVYCAVHPEALENPGGYFVNAHIDEDSCTEAGRDMDAALRLYEFSQELIDSLDEEEKQIEE